MHCALILLSVVVAAFASPSQLNLTAWNQFKLAHNKVYNLQEERLRFQIFSENLKKIEEHNALYKAGLKTYKKGVNQFTDLTKEEFKKFYLSSFENQPILNGTFGTFKPKAAVAVPESIDYRQRGAVNPVRSQGQCGGCWSFAAVACLESNNFLQTGNLLSLSEQNLIDCDNRNHGCNGGLAMFAYNYISDNGLESLSDYPYTGSEGTCKFSPSKSVINVQGYNLVTPKSEEALKAAVGTVGPVAISIDATELDSYTSGIFIAHNNDYKLNHAVVVVGYGSENGQDYWIVRNSWSERWGEQGYIRIARNYGNQIGIADRPVYPVL